MGPNDVGVFKMCDIRVPPLFITDAGELDSFPELLSHNDGFVSDSNSENRAIQKHNEHKSVSTVNSVHGTFDIVSHDHYISCCRRTDSSRWTISEERKGDIIEPSHDEHMLLANTDWSPVGGTGFGVDGGNGFEVVDVPHFGDDASNSGLWEDVDTFVSVVDVSGSDVIVEEEYESVCSLDIQATAVGGLEIIWEDEEYL